MQWLRTAEFVQGCSRLAHFPDAAQTVEIAVAGRSNAGKSSLLNRLCDNRRLARVSKAPGRTQEINLFRLPPHKLLSNSVKPPQMLLADLPGYGYAKVSRSLALGKLLTAYLTAPRRLCGLVLVTDIRRDLSEDDCNVLELCAQRDTPLLLLRGKADKASQSERAKAKAAPNAKQPLASELASESVLTCSARTGAGMEQIAAWIAARMREAVSDN